MVGQHVSNRKRDLERAERRLARAGRTRRPRSKYEGALDEVKWRVKAVASDAAACDLMMRHHPEKDLGPLTSRGHGDRAKPRDRASSTA